MRVALIGATGCGGRAVAAALTAAGDEVLAIARGQSAPWPAGVRVAACDRRDRERLAALLADFQADAVVDHVAYTHDDVTAVPPAARYVLVSSAVVYGPARLQPYHEGDLTEPADAFAAAKRSAEVAARACHGHVTCLRLGGLYGPGHAPLTPLGRDPELAGRLRRGEPILVPEDAGPLQPWFAADHGRLVAALVHHPAPPAVLNATGDEVLDWAALLGAWAAAADLPAPRLETRPAAALRALAPPHLAPFLDALWYPPLLDVRARARLLPDPTPFATGTRLTVAGERRWNARSPTR
jgi:nucleoside-diphosphate-sugar epimerase